VIGLIAGKMVVGMKDKATFDITVGESREMLAHTRHHRLAGKQSQNEHGYRAAKFKHWL
tara:strand:+ start:112 stop:288 length:177 start_codon:yes stop_codon:yes gene_type:complete